LHYKNFFEILKPILKYKKKNIAGIISIIPILLSIKESQSLVLRWLYLSLNISLLNNFSLSIAKEIAETILFTSFCFKQLKNYYKQIFINLSLTKFLQKKNV